MSVWQNNLKRLLQQKEVLILHGNVRDTGYIGGGGEIIKGLGELLRNTCKELGFNRLHSYGVLCDAAHDPHTPMWSLERIEALTPEETSSFRENASQEREATVLTRWLTEDLRSVNRKTVFVINYIERLAAYSQRGSYPRDANQLVALVEKLIENIPSNHRLVLVALQDTMIPPEYYANSPKTALHQIPLPDKKERSLYWSRALGALTAEQRDHLGDITDGLYFRDLQNIGNAILEELQRGNKLSNAQIRRMVNFYRLGTEDDPWAAISLVSSPDAKDPKGLLDAAEDWFRKRVIGQDVAVTAIVNAIKKARAGVTGLTGEKTTKPKAVFFFAGPPGVGKTYMAKKLSEYLFGSEDAFIRFDMSEFKEEHTVSRLLGAPPGYIGFENGGMLTNAVKARPFSVILFDEIEKSDGKIMDVFLQILDDGRLTDSRGQTVFFTESVIIFTSNIGTRTQNSRNQKSDERTRLNEIRRDSSRSASQRDEASRQHFVACVREFFTDELSRPELLSRMGSRIIPFNHISDSGTQGRIVQTKLAETVRSFGDRFSAMGHQLVICPEVANYILSSLDKSIETFDGRNPGHAIDGDVADLLSQQLLLAEMMRTRNVTFSVDVKNGQLVCERNTR